jgi:hypothetical protein
MANLLQTCSKHILKNLNDGSGCFWRSWLRVLKTS